MAFLPKNLRQKFPSDASKSKALIEDVSQYLRTRGAKLFVDPKEIQRIVTDEAHIKGREGHPLQPMLLSLNERECSVAERLSQRAKICFGAAERWEAIERYRQRQEVDPNADVDLGDYQKLLTDAQAESTQANMPDNAAMLAQLYHISQANEVVKSLVEPLAKISREPRKFAKQKPDIDSIMNQIQFAINAKDAGTAGALLEEANKKAYQLTEKITRPSFFKRLFTKKVPYKPLTVYMPSIDDEIDEPIPTQDASKSIESWLEPLKAEEKRLATEAEARAVAEREAAVKAAAEAKAARKAIEAVLKKRLAETQKPPVDGLQNERHTKQHEFRGAYVDILRQKLYEAVVLTNTPIDPSNKFSALAGLIGVAVGASPATSAIGAIADRVVDKAKQKKQDEAANIISYFESLPPGALEDYINPGIKELQESLSDIIEEVPAADVSSLAKEAVGRYLDCLSQGNYLRSLEPKDHLVLSMRTGTKHRYFRKDNISSESDDVKTAAGYFDRSDVDYNGEALQSARSNDADPGKHPKPKYQSKIHATRCMAIMCDMDTPGARQERFEKNLVSTLMEACEVNPRWAKEQNGGDAISSLFGNNNTLARELLDPNSDPILQIEELAKALYPYYQEQVEQAPISVNPKKDGITKLTKTMVEALKEATQSKSFKTWLSDTQTKVGKKLSPIQKAVYALQFKKSLEREATSSSYAQEHALKVNLMDSQGRIKYSEAFYNEFQKQSAGRSGFKPEDLTLASNVLATRYAERVSRIEERDRKTFFESAVQRSLDWISDEKTLKTRENMPTVRQLVMGVESGTTREIKPLKVIGQARTILKDRKDNNWSTKKGIYSESNKKYGDLPEIPEDLGNLRTTYTPVVPVKNGAGLRLTVEKGIEHANGILDSGDPLEGLQERGHNAAAYMATKVAHELHQRAQKKSSQPSTSVNDVKTSPHQSGSKHVRE